jgi:hypothetical protein
LRALNRHLGENVVGLRGLVDQVYRQIHHKVNREDIKKLISAKYVLLSYCSSVGYSWWTRHTGVGILLPWLSASLVSLVTVCITHADSYALRVFVWLLLHH